MGLMRGPILAIDTSGMTASVALYQERVLAEMSWHSGRRHSAQLLPAVDSLLTLIGVDKRALSGVAVAIGPGSVWERFSGRSMGAISESESVV